MSKEVKEFKITCLGCKTVRFVPYFESKEHTEAEKAKGCFGDIFTSLGLSLACLPLGCCTGLASIGDINTRNKTPEQKREKYFELSKVSVCKKCGSLAKNVEVITHNTDEIDK